MSQSEQELEQTLITRLTRLRCDRVTLRNC